MADPEYIGKYRILGTISEGGMGRLLRASMPGPGGFEREVAIKVIKPDKKDKASFAPMFIREANILASLTHENIVRLYDFDADGDELFLCMELVHGKDLRQWRDQWLAWARPLRAGPLRADLVVRVVEQVARGLDYAHRLRVGDKKQGLVHRDVSPSNILISFDGAVKLTDFGIAKTAGDNLTVGRVAKGKLPYMSPEQSRGEGLDGRSDIFSLGIVLWEALSAQRLFGSAACESDEVLAEVRTMPIKAPSHSGAPIPPELDDVVMKALERDVDRRYATAGDLADALQAVGSAHGLIATPYQIARALRTAFQNDVPSVGIDLHGASGITPSEAVRPRPPIAAAVDPPSGLRTVPMRPPLLPSDAVVELRSSEATLRTAVPAGAAVEDTDVPQATMRTPMPAGAAVADTHVPLPAEAVVEESRVPRAAEISTSPDRAARSPGWRWPAVALAGSLTIAALALALVRSTPPAQLSLAPGPSSAGQLPLSPSRGEGQGDSPGAGEISRSDRGGPPPAEEEGTARSAAPPIAKPRRRPPAPTGPPALLDVVSVLPVVDITIDGRDLGWSPHRGFALPPGRHRIVLKPEQGTRRAFTVHLPPAGHLVFHGPLASMKPQTVE